MAKVLAYLEGITARRSSTSSGGVGFIVNYRNKWAFTNSSDLREGSKVPLTSGTARLPALGLSESRFIGDLSGAGFRGFVVHRKCISNCRIHHNYESLHCLHKLHDRPWVMSPSSTSVRKNQICVRSGFRAICCSPYERW